MNVWTVANQKGGVGKTTTAVSLGGLLAQQGQRVLLIDLDPAGSLTAYFGHDPDRVEPSVYTLFQRASDGVPAPLAALLRRTSVSRLVMLPASTALVSLDRQFGAREGMGLVLSRALARWRDQFDYVLMDCAPQLGILMVNALACCDRLIVPVQTEFLALQGLERLMHTLRMIRAGRRLEFSEVLVPTMFDRRTRAATASLDALRSRHGHAVWSGEVPVDTKFREAAAAGLPVHMAFPHSRGAQAYAALLDALLGREGSDASLRAAV